MILHRHPGLEPQQHLELVELAVPLGFAVLVLHQDLAAVHRVHRREAFAADGQGQLVGAAAEGGDDLDGYLVGEPGEAGEALGGDAAFFVELGWNVSEGADE